MKKEPPIKPPKKIKTIKKQAYKSIAYSDKKRKAK
jgi:hypothetical protein